MSAIMIDGRPIMEKNMNYNMKILNYLLPILILFSINFSQDLSVDLTLLNTSQFTLNSWNNVAELWNVEVLNTSSEPVYYKLKFQLYQKISGNNELIVEGRTKILFIQNNGVPKIFSNLDPELNESSLEEYIEENPEFISNIENVTGYFPSGTYKLKLSAIEPESPYNEIASDEEDVEFSVGDQFSILNPPDGWIYADGESFYFQWDTPGFRQGVQMKLILLKMQLKWAPIQIFTLTLTGIDYLKWKVGRISRRVFQIKLIFGILILRPKWVWIHYNVALNMHGVLMHGRLLMVLKLCQVI